MTFLNSLAIHHHRQLALQPGVGLGLRYNMPPGLSVPYVPRLVLGFRNNYFLQGEVVSLTPNPQPGGPGYPLLSGPSPSTCPARVVLPVADATAGVALRIIWPRKPSHPALAIDKVEIPWRGTHWQLVGLNLNWIPRKITLRGIGGVCEWNISCHFLYIVGTWHLDETRWYDVYTQWLVLALSF